MATDIPHDIQQQMVYPHECAGVQTAAGMYTAVDSTTSTGFYR